MMTDEEDDSGDELLGLFYVYFENQLLSRLQISRRRFWVRAVIKRRMQRKELHWLV